MRLDVLAAGLSRRDRSFTATARNIGSKLDDNRVITALDQVAHQVLIETGRKLPANLAQHGATEQTQEQFMKVQAAIDVVDRALLDEKTAASKGQYSRESR